MNLDDFVKCFEKDCDPGCECDEMPKKGTIIIKCVLGDCEDGEALEGVEIELYKIDECIAPGFKLVDRKITDEKGKVSFKCLDFGQYRIKEVVPCNCHLTVKYHKSFKIRLTRDNDKVTVTILNLPHCCYNNDCDC